MTIYSIVPNPETLLSLEPEEVAGVVLEYINSMPDHYFLSRHNFGLSDTVKEYPREQWTALSRVLMEGWVWLEREGLIVPKPGESSGSETYFISRRGKQVSNRDGLAAYKRSDLLPRHLLHPQIAQKVWSMFLRGEYDVAVFQAFKEVEVAVREKIGASNELIGVALMREAFNIKNGLLTDLSAEKGEREAVQHLFAGAIGSYKNPHSHRNVIISDPTEAVEMIILASHLLKIVESRQVKN